ncbi:MAG: FAD:protein FMN transferase [Arenimonas sp.]|uniref:FAD:protein FMN transferase n=1 Tax=Arenimonas sp. TaxID=1872635 RepID=UPI0025BE7D77|nr:FAD:protein FMN transferase [Arenimonas sp.]MBW8366902.1 FAD:protein FMN transferase [Arenimonas sp.]
MRPAASTSEAWPRTLVAAGLWLALAACSRGPAPRIEELHVFGATTQIEIRGAAPEQAQAAMADVSALLSQRESEWHAWKPSDVTRINAAFKAGLAAPAPASVIDLVERSKPLSEASEGLFDPAVGGLVAAWGFHTSSYPVLTPPPSKASLEQWRQQRPRIADVQVRGGQLQSANPRVQLDFGAIAEGAAARDVLAALARHGVQHALVNLGGDVVALGDGDGRPWQAALRDPFGGVLGGVALTGGEALFSTGNYSKFRDSPTGARWSHILDPRTGYPARGAAAVVVLHTDPVLADSGATALFVAGPAGFERLVRQMGLACAVMVTDENEMLVTVAMRQRLELLREPVPLGQPVDLGPDCAPR